MDSYEIFYRTFLSEMPWVIPGSNDFAAQRQMLEELLSDGAEPEQVGDGVYKITSGNQLTYWIGDQLASRVSIIVDTEVFGNFCKVVLTSKNPKIAAGSPPYASDLYLLIKQDLATLDLVFASDSILSNDAVKLWNRLADQGKHISVYDTQSSKYVLNSINSAKDLNRFLGGQDSGRYVFVLSESADHARGLTHWVALMGLKRNAGYPLLELYKKFKEK